LLPGESISKYRGLAPTPVSPEHHSKDAEIEVAATATEESAAPVAATFPEYRA
jgi:hypothetical protein